MDPKKIMQIFEDTAYVHTGGSAEELKAAEYIQSVVAGMGLEASLMPFPVDMADIHEAVLEVDGVSYPCKGFRNAGSSTVEAPFYYLTNTDRYSLEQCRGKIVMIDGFMGFWRYHDLVEYGAVGFITYSGNCNCPDRDIDQRELRCFIREGKRIMPGVNINVKDAMEIVRSCAKTARLTLRQDEYTVDSRNVILDMPGESDEYIVLTAHYDTTSLSCGTYDNMSGSVGLMGIAEYFAAHPHKRGLRFVWCGSEERGLLGSKAYCNTHEEELKKIVLCVNMDMIGSIMGKFAAVATAEEKLCDYVAYMANEYGYGIETRQDVYASDSTPFADHGVPAITFARCAPKGCGTIHERYDTIALMSGEQMAKDIDFIIAFTDRMANAARCPVAREIPDNMKDKLDGYMNRKRPAGK
ncbi:MAG: Zn-dependent exopeptidase M28 [Oscillospiraceae bacterium]|nr:Zn-dependent exopeptidase M28 [Oscillospiraceae bacterium]